MPREQQKRKFSALNSEEEEEQEDKELNPEVHSMENNSRSNSEETKLRGLIHEQNNPFDAQNLENQSSNGIANGTEFMESCTKDLEAQSDCSTRAKRTRVGIFPDSESGLDEYNNLVLPLDPEVHSMENTLSSNSEETKLRGFIQLHEQNNPNPFDAQNLDNQSSNSIANDTEFMESCPKEEEPDSSTQEKRPRFNIFPDSETGLDEYNNLVLPQDPEVHSMENTLSSNSEETKLRGLIQLHEQNNPNPFDAQNLDNQSSNSIANGTEFMESFPKEEQPDSSTQANRTRFGIFPDSDTGLDEYNNLVLPLDPEIHSMENTLSSNSEETKLRGLIQLHEQNNPNPFNAQNLDNQSSNSIGNGTEFMESFPKEEQPDSSTQEKRTRFNIFPDSDTDLDEYNNQVLPPFNISLYVPPIQSPTSSSSTDHNHLSCVGVAGSSDSLSSERDLPDSDNASEDNLSGGRVSALENPEVIDLSSPLLTRGSSDVVDLTMEPNSPTGSNFVDLTGEAVEQLDSSPVIVSVNKIYQRNSVIQPIQLRPSCRFEVMPSSSSFQDDSITDLTDEKYVYDDDDDDDDVSIENVKGEPCVNNSNIKSTSSGESKKNEEKEKFDKSITCPICLDDANLIKRKRQLSSTTCGHVFCDKCIKNALKAQSKCPTCRKKLTLRQIHPLFL